ncbi:MAG: hypothetical protein SH868_07965 [Bythopirellula sp.]|nr:hypothetical protein [Bythopirellula sp.]
MNRFKNPTSLFLATLAMLAWSSANTASAQIPAPTIITFPWDWHIEVIPEGGNTPIPIGLWGTATVAFGEPSDGTGNTFPLGPGGGLGAPIPGPVPPGNWTIPIELVQMDLVSMGPVTFPGGTTPVLIRESPTRPSQGRIENLQNNGDGTVQLDSFFDIFVEIDLPALGMALRNEQPMTAGMSFGRPGGPFMNGPPLPEVDVLWAPTWIWQVYPPGTAPAWVDPALHPWDRWISIHAHVTVPEPQSLALVALSGMALVSLWRSRKV